MPSSEGTERAKGHSGTYPEQWEGFIQKHLTVHYNKEKNLVEIGWAGECGDKSCPVPHTTVVFYSCPSKPCPPWKSGGN
jgi:hypothetical protein